MKVGVIGGGTVGKAVARTYLEFVDEVRVYDTDPGKTTHGIGHTAFGKVLECNLLFICLPTPQHAMGGGLDVSVVEDFCRSLKGPDHDYTAKNLVLKSTVPVGTTRRLSKEYNLPNLVHSPEFLTARCAEVDARIPAVNVIGLPEPPSSIDNLNHYHTWHNRPLYKLLRRRFPGTETHVMSSDNSEAAKLALNTWFAVKVSWFNELKSFCDALECDFETVRRVILADGRTTAHHTQVPGPDGKRGFGGTCLPKDLSQFIEHFVSATDWPLISEAAQKRNRVSDRGEHL